MTGWKLASVILAMILAASAPACARPIKPITGTFIQLDGGNLSYTADQWRAEFAVMKKLGCDTLIVGEVARQETGFCKLSKYPLYQKCGTPDPLKAILDTAKECGFKVFVGIYAWDWKKWDSAYFQEYAKRCCDIATEVWERHGKHPAFAGWYALGLELSNAPALDDIAVKTFTVVVPHLRELSGKLPILTAPFFGLGITPEALEEGWKKLLPVLGVDIVAMQDGVGCDRKITPELCKPYFRAMSNACRACKVIPWADVEVFDQLAGWKPAQPDRVVEQLKAIGPHVEKIVIWEFNHYLSPNKGLKSLDGLVEAIGKARGECP